MELGVENIVQLEDRAIGRSAGGSTTKIHWKIGRWIHNKNTLEDRQVDPQQKYIGRSAGGPTTKIHWKIGRWTHNKNTHGLCDAQPMIPRRKNSKKPNAKFDKNIYKSRHQVQVENVFARLKHFRSVWQLALKNSLEILDLSYLWHALLCG